MKIEFQIYLISLYPWNIQRYECLSNKLVGGELMHLDQYLISFSTVNRIL